MTEQQLLNKIRESADQVELPNSLTPEQVARHLKTQSPKKTKPVFHFHPAKAVSVAAVLLLCGILSAVAWNSLQISPDTGNESAKCLLKPSQENNASGITDTAPAPKNSKKGNTSGNHTDHTETEGSKEEPKRDAGTLYTVAESYDQVYDILKSSYRMESTYRKSSEKETSDADTGIESGAADFDTALNYNTATTGNAALKTEHSSTNLQTKGVDESDIIKTDGRYIYTVTGAMLKITDTTGGELKEAGAIDTNLEASDHILEFYLDGSKLFLLIQHNETSLTEETSYIMDDSDSGIIPLTDCAKVETVETEASTILYTYDITDPASPVLTGTTEQDGYYHTSRKIGDIIYLFTQQGLKINDSNGFVPCVNEEKVPYDHIYVPDQGSQGFLISSVNISDPEKTIDQVMLVHDSVNVYVATDAIYLYNTDYQANDDITQIAKFSIEDGIINAVNATSVKGGIYDTFAINAYQDTLRILTTYNDRNGNTDNHLYILDKDLKLTGSLDGIARGERIYAARYLGNTAYFITYKNIDPLFAVDLTDPASPVLLGELEITGFSDYLHFWGEDQLLGIGYETDPDTGEQKGLKLVMFDISNPSDLKILDTAFLKNSYYSPALYDYKCVLAEPQKNLIGFAAEHNHSNRRYYAAYHVFSFENGRFQKKLEEALPDYEYISYDSIRGLYIEDSFYITCPTEITSYDMIQEFQKTGKIDLD